LKEIPVNKFVLVATVVCAGLAVPTIGESLAPAPMSQPDSSPNPSIIPPNSPIVRLLYSVLSANWWKWAVAQSPEHFPLIDPTGANQQYGQSGPVWFLAGNFGGTDVRNVTVPYGKFIYFPVINAEWDTVPGFTNPLSLPDPLSVGDIRAITAWFIDGNSSSCTIDGREVQQLQQYRVRSPVFSFDIHPDLAPVIGYPVTHVSTAVSDGVWLLLAPMTRGQHTIHFSAASPHGFVLDITYNITVQ